MIDVRASNNTRSPIRSKVIQVSCFRSQHRKFVIKYPFLYIHFFSLCPVYPKASLRFKLRFFQTDNFLTSSSSISSLLLLVMYIVWRRLSFLAIISIFSIPIYTCMLCYIILSNIVNFEISMNKLLMHVKTNNISVKLTLRGDLH